MINKQQTSNMYGLSQELLFMSELVNYGVVSIPYGNSGRYDCILDIEGDLYKIQIKSVNQINEDTIIVPFANSRMSAEGAIKKEYTSDEVDYIGIVYNYNLYLFPCDMASKSLTVRLSNQNLKTNSHYLEDYRIDKILNIDLKTWVQLKEETRETKGENVNSPQHKCIYCNSPVYNKDSMCINCARLASRKVERPTREELKDLIRKNSFSSIGKKYSVTDNSIRKWCKTYNLPFRVQDIRKYNDKEWEEV